MFRKLILISVTLSIVSPSLLFADTPSFSVVPRFNFTAADIEAQCRAAVTKFHANLGAVLTNHEPTFDGSYPEIPPVINVIPVTFESFIVPLEHAAADLMNATKKFRVMADLSIDQSIRDAAANCSKLVEDAERDFTVDSRFADPIRAMSPPPESREDEKRLYDAYLESFEEGGAFHPTTAFENPTYNPYVGKGTPYKGTVKDYYLGLLKRLDILTIDFRKNVSDDASSITATVPQLQSAGFTEEQIKDKFEHDVEQSASLGEEVYKVSVSANWLKIMKSAADATLRRNMLHAYENRAAATNDPVIREIMWLFQEIAKTRALVKKPTDSHDRPIENPSYADYALDGTFIGDQTNLAGYWSRVENDLHQRREQENSELLKLKIRDANKNPQQALTKEELALYDVAGVASIRIQPWDVYYYPVILAQEKLPYDTKKMETLFTYDSVANNTFRIFGKLLGLQINEIALDASNEYTWPTAVASNGGAASTTIRLFEVRESTNATGQAGEILGYFFLDPSPRPKGTIAKIGVPIAMPVIVGGQDRNGHRRLPVSILSGVLNKDSNNHYAICNFIHEFFHILHSISTQARFYSQAGTNVVMDYKEMVALVGEYFGWQKSVLAQLIDPTKVDALASDEFDIDEQLQGMEDSLGYTLGPSYFMRQFYYGKYQMAIRGLRLQGLPPDLDTRDPVKLARALYYQSTGIEPFPDTHMVSGIAQLVIGADYYSYNTGSTYAFNMLERFKEKGLFSARVGEDFRRLILEPGDSKAPQRQVDLFLRSNLTTEEIVDDAKKAEKIFKGDIIAQNITMSLSRTKGSDHEFKK